MKVIRNLILLAILGGLAFGGYKVFKYFQEEKNAWKIEVTSEFINVRSGHSAIEGNLGKVGAGDVFKVLDIYLEDKKFVWYKIEYVKDKAGWIASSRNNPYVKEMNNPDVKDGETNAESYVIDYERPIVKFYQEIYYTKDIDSITYDHLSIEDDSDYTVTHEVYYEEDPIDSDIPQYWIKYTVVDARDNTTSKTQRIVFEKEPSQDEVKDFSELKK